MEGQAVDKEEEKVGLDKEGNEGLEKRKGKY